MHALHPDVHVMAEESTSWPRVSRPSRDGGLGFTHKWTMGWMHDTLSYFQKHPIHRQHHHHQVTFGLLYALSEDFVLPISGSHLSTDRHSSSWRCEGTLTLHDHRQTRGGVRR